MDGDALRQAGAVLLVLALLGAALFAFRHVGWFRAGIIGPAGLASGNGGVRPLETIDRITLSPQHSLHVVSAEGRRLLVAVHPQGCTLLVDFGGSGKTADGGAAS